MIGLSIVIAIVLVSWLVAKAIERRIWLDETMAANVLKLMRKER